MWVGRLVSFRSPRWYCSYRSRRTLPTATAAAGGTVGRVVQRRGKRRSVALRPVGAAHHVIAAVLCVGGHRLGGAVGRLLADSLVAGQARHLPRAPGHDRESRPAGGWDAGAAGAGSARSPRGQGHRSASGSAQRHPVRYQGAAAAGPAGRCGCVLPHPAGAEKRSLVLGAVTAALGAQRDRLAGGLVVLAWVQRPRGGGGAEHATRVVLPVVEPPHRSGAGQAVGVVSQDPPVPALWVRPDLHGIDRAAPRVRYGRVTGTGVSSPV